MYRLIKIFVLEIWLLYEAVPLSAQIISISSSDINNLFGKQDNPIASQIPFDIENKFLLSPPFLSGEFKSSAGSEIPAFTFSQNNKPQKLSSTSKQLSDAYGYFSQFSQMTTTQPVIDSDRKFFREVYNPPKIDEEKRIRQLWRDAFGLDVWHPYYKAKEIEDWVKERFSVKIFKFKGKPAMEKNKFAYTFKAKF